MDNNWKQDPRLKAMDPEKVTLLTGFADSETALLVEILSCHMPEKDRKKLQFLKLAAGKIAGGINR